MIRQAAVFLILGFSLGVGPALSQAPIAGPEMGSAATASEAPVPAPPPAASAETPAAPVIEGNYPIIIIGDGLAGGLGAGLSRLAAPEPAYQVINRFQETSGLARPEVYEWADNLPNIMANKDIKAAVILIGINDRQDIHVGDQLFSFGSPDWQKAYSAQVQRLINALKALQVKIYWVALPPMADAQYESDMQIIRELQKKAADQTGVTYLDFRSSFTNPDGSYTDRGPDDTGEVRKLRTRDGVTFLKQGNNKLGQLMLGAIKAGLVAPASPQAPTAEPQPAPIVNAAGGKALPLFGQSLVDGSSQVVEPDMTPSPTIGSTITKINTGVSITAADLVKGSGAEKLFVEGLAPAAPAGRIDDFSAASNAPAPNSTP